MDKGEIVGMIFLIIFFFVGFFIGHCAQARRCHNTFSDGRRYVVVNERDKGNKFYLLGEEIPKPIKVRKLEDTQQCEKPR